MATFLPEAPDDFHGSPGEKSVYRALEVLSDDYFVFHSLEWVSDRRQMQGEADFVVFHRQLGILVIEVKGGGIRLENRRWYQTNRHTQQEREINDPVGQAKRSKFEIINLLKDNKITRCLVASSVWFPDVVFNTQVLPPDLATDIVFDNRTLVEPETAIKRAFSFWKITSEIETNLNSNEVSRVVDLLAPRFHLTATVVNSHYQNERQFVRLTEQQLSVIDLVEFQAKAVINGIAGTGKTIVALAKARALSARNEHVLFLCYNKHLRKYLQENHPIPLVEYHTFHSLASSIMEVSSTSFDKLESDFLAWLEENASEKPFHHIIIDEGQDYKRDWLEYLELANRETFYVFCDMNQSIFNRELTQSDSQSLDELNQWFNDAPCKLTLSRVVRSTKPIISAALRCLGNTMQKLVIPIDGPSNTIQFYNDSNELTSLLSKSIKHDLTILKLKPHDIAIVSVTTENEMLRVKLHTLTKQNISDSLIPNSIVYTSIGHFKGLEASKIYLIDIEWNKIHLISYRKRLYTAFSRARHQLVLFCNPPDDALTSTIIQSLRGSEHAAGTTTRIAKLLHATIVNLPVT